MIWGIAAYVMWGFFPAYFPLLEPATPLEVLAHRFLWTLLVMLLIVGLTGQWRHLLRITAHQWLLIAAAAVLIATNWGLYVYAVNNDHVADAALGYFINPLVSVLLGILILGERLRLLQWLAVGIATIAVLLLTISLGSPPIVSLGLAITFGVYGLIKKRITLGPLVSLTAETLILAPVGVLYLLSLGPASTFTALGPGHTLLLMATGLITALPLLFFARAAHAMTLTSLGMIQYICPVMQMLWAVFVVHEHIEPMRWVGFIIIWVAVALYLSDLALNSRAARQQRRAPATGPQAAGR